MLEHDINYVEENEQSRRNLSLSMREISSGPLDKCN